MEPENLIAAVVVDDEHPDPGQSLLALADPQRKGLLLESGGEPKRRAFVQFAFNTDIALHHPDQLPGDG
jgi:hypothetical protein